MPPANRGEPAFAGKPSMGYTRGGPGTPDRSQGLSAFMDLFADLTPARGLVDPGEPLRRVRAGQLLERMNTPTARSVLEQLASGTSGTAAAEDARAALRRMTP